MSPNSDQGAQISHRKYESKTFGEFGLPVNSVGGLYEKSQKAPHGVCKEERGIRFEKSGKTV